MLSPATATIIFALGCISGVQYRRIWKAEGPTWQLWVSGTIAGAAFLTVAFVPVVAG
ncbi:MAG: hypothetical protein AAF580_05490 [Pseudomonadota bacterium]